MKHTKRIVSVAIAIAIAAILPSPWLLAQTTHSVSLSWSCVSGCLNGTGFNVYRGTATGAEVKLPGGSIPSISTTTFTDTSGTGNVLVEGTKYFYYLTTVGQCRDSGGVVTTCESAPSMEVTATIPFSTVPAPGPATGLSAIPH